MEKEQIKISQQLKELSKKIEELKDTPWIFLEELLAEPKKAIHFRAILNAVYGKEIAIPFVDTVEAGESKILVSKMIPYRFSVSKLIAVFSGAENNLKIYFFVSEDNDTSSATGYNLLSDYSTTPYLVGDTGVVEISSSPEEFEDEKYIKCQGVNSGTSNLPLSAIAIIRIYPPK